MYKRLSKADKARQLNNQWRAWELSCAMGRSLPEIAAELQISVKTAGRCIDREAARQAAERKPRSPEEIEKGVVSQSAPGLALQDMIVRRMVAVESDPKISESDKLFSIAAGARAWAELNKRLSAMNAWNAPTKIIEEQTRRSLNVSLTKNIEGRVVVEFDRDQLKPRWTPLEGLLDASVGAPPPRLTGGESPR